MTMDRAYQDVTASFWSRQAWNDKAGHPGELKYLKGYLKTLIAEAQFAARPSFVVRIERETADGPQLVHSLKLGA